MERFPESIPLCHISFLSDALVGQIRWDDPPGVESCVLSPSLEGQEHIQNRVSVFILSQRKHQSVNQIYRMKEGLKYLSPYVLLKMYRWCVVITGTI